MYALSYKFYLRYNARYQPATPFGEDWGESSKKYTDFLLVISCINWTHPGFDRALATPRSAQDSTSIQVLCAERILHVLNTPNLLLSGSIMWGGGGVDVRQCLTPSNNPPGFTTTELCDSASILGLNLPQISKVDAWELLLLGTGPFSQHGGWSVLTAAR